jgi:hypothetical protein
MADAESPASLCELLYTRFPGDTPNRIAYDNACNAIHYMLNREPDFARNVDFYIDSLHFTKGHPKCCKSYDTGMKSCPVLRHIEISGCLAIIPLHIYAIK